MTMYEVRAESLDGSAVVLRKGFFTRDATEDQPVILADWQRVWVQSTVGTSPPHIAEIQYAVASRFGVPMKEMTSQRRARRFARPRQVAMYLSSEMTPHSLPSIGRHFGNRDHTTVMHACRVIAEKMVIDRDLERAVADIRWVLGSDPNQGVLPLHEHRP